MSEHVTVALRGREHSYEILVGQNLLEKSGSWVRSVTSGVGKVVIISNELVFSLYGETVCASLAAAGIESRVWKMGDGESFKSLETAEQALRFFSENKLSRSDAVIALGGGVVGDLTGFAAAVYLRGVPFLQIPTTLLSMIDSSVGGKTGVNSSFGKNLIGAFHQPSGVMIDVQTLKTVR
jgi:3-dehydroquinate synthase